jgi:hypothetical protein
MTYDTHPDSVYKSVYTVSPVVEPPAHGKRALSTTAAGLNPTA